MGVPTYRRPPNGQLDDPAADFGEAVARLDPISAKLVLDVELAPLTTVQYFSHGLGRAYRGGIVVGQEDPGLVYVVHPRSVADAAKKIGVAQSTAASQVVRLLVF